MLHNKLRKEYFTQLFPETDKSIRLGLSEDLVETWYVCNQVQIGLGSGTCIGVTVLVSLRTLAGI
jgi:hypothetical protein